MSDQPQLPPDDPDGWVRNVASHLPYPPAPNIARRVLQHLPDQDGVRVPGRPRRRNRRWIPVVAVAVVILLALLATPRVRAELGQLLRIGRIRIMLTTPSPVPSPQLTPSPQPTSIPDPLLDITGATTLQQAHAAVPFLMPSYPPQIGPPQRVFLQDFGGPVAVLVWLQPESKASRFSLHVLGPAVIAEKLLSMTSTITATTIDGHPAAWVQGPHMINFYRTTSGGNSQQGRSVTGNVLIWERDGLTYRLEGDLTFAEALRIATSTSEVLR